MSATTAVAGVAAVALAVPAAATVFMRNYMSAEVTAEAACFVKVGGRDTANYGDSTKNPYVAVDTTATYNTSDGVTLLQETMTVEGYQGDRTIYTDVVRYRNNCDYPMSLQLLSEADLGGNAATAGALADRVVRIYLGKATQSFGGNVADAASMPFSGDDLASSANWDQAPLQNDSSGMLNAATGSVTVPSGHEVQGAVVVDASTTATGALTLRWTAEATFGNS